MEIKDWIILVLAIWGAGLSTYQEIRRRKQEKRQVGVFLEYIAFEERYRLVIVNTGFRPVTITSIGMNAYGESERGEYVDPVPATSHFSVYKFEGEENKLPVTLKDGEQKVISLAEVLPSPHSDEKLEVIVYDAEGNKYTTDKPRVFDGKYHVYYEDQ